VRLLSWRKYQEGCELSISFGESGISIFQALAVEGGETVKSSGTFPRDVCQRNSLFLLFVLQLCVLEEMAQVKQKMDESCGLVT
jgi:hypothetical protein